MRRLISILAGGLLAGGTVLTTAGAASAGTTAARPPATSCTNVGAFFFSVTKSGVNYYLGAPRKPSPGAAAFLKPTTNGSTTWTICESGAVVVFENGGLALSSRSAGGADVTMETVGNSGNGFSSQQWTFSGVPTAYTFQNVKTGLYLRVRNNGPIMGQTVTTGNSSTPWALSG
ncbi:MAG: RICIN domain-containing protein [Streptosporangiaceae bacterium]